MKRDDLREGARYRLKGDTVVIDAIAWHENARRSVITFRVTESASTARPIGYVRSWGLANFATAATPLPK